MSEVDIKALVDEAEVVLVEGDNKENVWEVDLIESLNRAVIVEANDEKQARQEAIKVLEAEPSYDLDRRRNLDSSPEAASNTTLEVQNAKQNNLARFK